MATLTGPPVYAVGMTASDYRDQLVMNRVHTPRRESNGSR
jgi:hypothetical protein